MRRALDCAAVVFGVLYLAWAWIRYPIASTAQKRLGLPEDTAWRLASFVGLVALIPIIIKLLKGAFDVSPR